MIPLKIYLIGSMSWRTKLKMVKTNFAQPAIVSIEVHRGHTGKTVWPWS